jgi:diguanylate cyclase
LQEDTDTAGTEALAAKICKALAAPVSIDGNRTHSSASIGIVPYSADVADPEAMMTKADLALFRAKTEGRDCFRFHVRELDDTVRERVAIGEGLHSAIENEEMELYYQPQVELVSTRLVGLEALLRWNHPTRGLLLPDQFIPIAESSGGIVQIGQWVIEQVCRQIAEWQRQGLAPHVVAANISAGQFKLAGDIDRIIATALAKHGVAPERLELELTESVLMEATQRHGEDFERLRRVGVRLAIDDFGTGYSSLDYLRSFRVARLKIDRSFVGGVTTGSDDATIVRAVIGLARALGIEVVAEGVETAAQRAFLISAGCRFAQGYYFGKPMPALAATALLQKECAAAG